MLLLHFHFAGTKLEEESEVDMLRSILAQLEFRHIVRQYDEHGILFRTYLHVPEVHGMVFLREKMKGMFLRYTMYMHVHHW